MNEIRNLDPRGIFPLGVAVPAAQCSCRFNFERLTSPRGQRSETACLPLAFRLAGGVPRFPRTMTGLTAQQAPSVRTGQRTSAHSAPSISSGWVQHCDPSPLQWPAPQGTLTGTWNWKPLGSALFAHPPS